MTLTKIDLLAIGKVVDDKLHENLTNYHADMIQPQFDKINKEIVLIKNELKATRNELKDEIKGLKGEFSQQVSKIEFNKFKTKVESHLHLSSD